MFSVDNKALFDLGKGPGGGHLVRTAEVKAGTAQNPGKAHYAPLDDSKAQDALLEVGRAGGRIAALGRPQHGRDAVLVDVNREEEDFA